MRKLFTFLFSATLLLVACNNPGNEKKKLDGYEKDKLSVAEIESKHPGRFLSVNISNKKNLLGQTVVKGKIINNAKMVSYKDIGLKLSFYSKTGTLLEQDQEVIYETLQPGGEKSFKSKYFAPKGTDSVSVLITGAAKGD